MFRPSVQGSVFLGGVRLPALCPRYFFIRAETDLRSAADIWRRGLHRRGSRCRTLPVSRLPQTRESPEDLRALVFECPQPRLQRRTVRADTIPVCR